MDTSTLGGTPIISEEQALVEQRRLAALLEITTSHKKEVQGLKSQLEAAEKKVTKFSVQAKSLDGEIKTLRAHNPDRMKKQIKRLQEQNRDLTAENNTLKSKQKKLQQQVQRLTLELERAQTGTEKGAEKEAVAG